MSGELPTGWSACTLGEIVERIETGKSVKCDERPPQGEENGLVKISAVTWGKFNEQESKTLFDSSHLKPAEKIQLGDFLISRANTLELVGSCVLVKQLSKSLYLSDKVLRLVLANESKPWLLACLRTQNGRIQIESLATGNQLSMRNISQQALKEIRIPLPPLAEQTRIAQKLDELLAQVDTLKSRIDAIPTLLKRCRQSVLTAAVSGRLTESWRDGQTPEWSYQKAADVCDKVQSGGTPKEGFTNSGVAFLKVYNIVNQKVDFDYRAQYITEAIHKGSSAKSIAKPGDVIMNIVGPPLGKIATIPASHEEWNINQAITLFRPSNRIISGWITIVLEGGESLRNIMNETKGSAGQVNISLSQCRNFVFPVPSIAEQEEIVRRVEQLFAFADQLEAKVASAKSRIDHLTQSILAKAFRGELVPQDPNDEPASVLLERIKAQRAAAPKPKRGRKASV